MDWAAVKLLRGAEHDVFCVTLPGVGCGSAGPPVPPARGLPRLQLDPKVEIPTPASSTDTAASPTLGKRGQMDPGSSQLNGKPGTGRVCTALFVIPFVPNVCWNLLFVSILYSQIFDFLSFFRITYIYNIKRIFFVVLTTWHKNERGTFRQKAEKLPVSPLPPQWDTPQTIPPCSFLKGIHGKHSPEKTPGCVYPVSHGCA